MMSLFCSELSSSPYSPLAIAQRLYCSRWYLWYLLPDTPADSSQAIHCSPWCLSKYQSSSVSGPLARCSLLLECSSPDIHRSHSPISSLLFYFDCSWVFIAAGSFSSCRSRGRSRAGVCGLLTAAASLPRSLGSGVWPSVAWVPGLWAQAQ